MSDEEQTKRCPNGRAPTAVIEVIVVGRPYKVLSLMMIIAAAMMFFISCASSNWLQNSVVRVGLWEECLQNVTNVPKPYCSDRPCNKAYALTCGAFSVISIILCFVAVVVLARGMFLTDVRMKFRFYNITLCINGLAVVLYLVPLIGYPIMLMQEIAAHPKHRGVLWHIGWAYGVGWAGIVFEVISSILLYVDKPSEEIVYREKICRDTSTCFE